MSATKSITFRLDPADYERLEAEATRLRVAPATLVRVYVRAALSGGGETQAAKDRRAGLAALEELAALRERLPDGQPPLDVVRIIAEGRQELDQRLDI